MEDIIFAKKRKQGDKDAEIEYYHSISMYDIRNAHSSMHTHASMDTNGMIGHLFLFKK
jgi:hypothetical protein